MTAVTDIAMGSLSRDPDIDAIESYTEESRVHIPDSWSPEKLNLFKFFNEVSIEPFTKIFHYSTNYKFQGRH